MASESRDGPRLAADLHREMRVTYVDRLPELAGPLLVSDGYLDLTSGAFRFTSPGGARFHYALGCGISAIEPDAGLADEFELFLWGTVFGAVTWLNGFFALHASAVEFGGRAIAFTADSGGGKSTLAAALDRPRCNARPHRGPAGGCSPAGGGWRGGSPPIRRAPCGRRSSTTRWRRRC